MIMITYLVVTSAALAEPHFGVVNLGVALQLADPVVQYVDLPLTMY